MVLPYFAITLSFSHPTTRSRDFFQKIQPRGTTHPKETWTQLHSGEVDGRWYFFKFDFPTPPQKKKTATWKNLLYVLGCQSPLPGWKKGPKGCSYTTSRDLKLKRLIFHDCILSVFFLTVFFAKQDCSAPHVYQVCSKFSLINSKTLRNFRSWGSCFFPSRRLKNFFNTEFNTFTVDYHWIRREHAEKKSYPGFKTRGSFFVPYFEWKIFLWPLL